MGQVEPETAALGPLEVPVEPRAAPVEPVLAPINKGSSPSEAPGALPFLLAALPCYHILMMPDLHTCIISVT